MGLGDTDQMNDKGGEETAAVPCSICFDSVTIGADRSTARLQCGHEFHLDCIGSAFNAKGVMQCPNCRKVEKGNWLYANGSRSSMHEWTHDEDLYDLNLPELPYGVHWCPFDRLTQITSSFEEGETSPAISFQDLSGHHAIFTEHLATPSTVHPCPYLAYFQPLHPSPTPNSHVYTGNLVDGPAYWGQVHGPTDIQAPHALPAIDLHYHSWEHHSPTYSTHGSGASGTDQASVSSATMMAGRLDSDGRPRPGSLVHPFLAHRSGSRASGSFVSSVIPPLYLTNTGGLGHVHDHNYHHHHSPGPHGSVFTGVRRSGGTRGMASIGPAPLSPPPYLFPPSRPSGRSPQDAESTEGGRFYAWERDPFTPFPLLHVDRESGWWGPSDSGSRVGIWHRHPTERPMASQGRSEGSSNQQPTRVTRMRPFI